jgi:hypothetical protein
MIFPESILRLQYNAPVSTLCFKYAKWQTQRAMGSLYIKEQTGNPISVRHSPEATSLGHRLVVSAEADRQNPQIGPTRSGKPAL